MSVDDTIKRLDEYLNGDPDALEYKDISALRDEIARLRRCDQCGNDRTLHPSGNFYECLPCYQTTIRLRKIEAAAREARERVKNFPSALTSNTWWAEDLFKSLAGEGGG